MNFSKFNDLGQIEVIPLYRATVHALKARVSETSFRA
jgi:hypothetical protein